MIAEFLLSQVISLFDPSNYKPNTKPIAQEIKPPVVSPTASSPVQSNPNQFDQSKGK